MQPPGATGQTWPRPAPEPSLPGLCRGPDLGSGETGKEGRVPTWRAYRVAGSTGCRCWPGLQGAGGGSGCGVGTHPSLGPEAQGWGWQHPGPESATATLQLNAMEVQSVHKHPSVCRTHGWFRPAAAPSKALAPGLPQPVAPTDLHPGAWLASERGHSLLGGNCSPKAEVGPGARSSQSAPRPVAMGPGSGQQASADRLSTGPWLEGAGQAWWPQW